MDKEQIAIARLREASEMSFRIYGQPLIVTTSGGKDSSVCVALAQRAGIPFEVMHNHTTADAPETVYFVRSELKRLESMGIPCRIQYPQYKGIRTSMWALISQWGVPNRFNRFCCNVLKENGGKGRFLVTGVRWEESLNRKKRGIYESLPTNKKNKIILNNDNDENRNLFETCQLKSKRVCNPIIDWTERDVWEYLISERIPANPLYNEGWNRVGCVGCPIASTKIRYANFKRWPKYKAMYCAAIERNLQKMQAEGKNPIRDTVEDLFHWWMEDGVLPGQLSLEEDLTE